MMAEIQVFWKFLLIFVSSTVINQALAEGDCMYNRCSYKFRPQAYLSHEPCLGTGGRGLVRNVECDDGNTIHICCRLPYRDDIQKSRQKWFRSVTKAGHKISHTCTKRIMCEQACKDGLNGNVRSSYPQVLPDDSPANKDYVDAWNSGEASSCFTKPTDTHPYDGASCESDCQKKYPACDQELQDSKRVWVYYNTARGGHKMGMFSFSAVWLGEDAVNKALDMGKTALQATYDGFNNVLGRMNKLNDAYQNWLNEKEHKTERRKRSLPEQERWNEYLIIYNATDVQLVEVVYESLDYAEFVNVTHYLNETLATYDFKKEEWVQVDSGGNGQMPLFLGAVFALVTFVFLG